MTRSLSEATAVPHGCYPTIVWGIGVHPGDSTALDRYDGDRFSRLLPRFPLVGEIGLDRRAGGLDRQRAVFVDILERASDAPALMSIHSSGLAREVLDLVERHRPRAPILHWFTGDTVDITRATAAGAWFSVNAAATPETLAALSADRVLTETDFPFTRRRGSARPGGTEPIEARLADVWNCDVHEVRLRVWQNLAGALKQGGVAGLATVILDHVR
jgi:TatD DNase family protein